MNLINVSKIQKANYYSLNRYSNLDVNNNNKDKLYNINNNKNKNSNNNMKQIIKQKIVIKNLKLIK